MLPSDAASANLTSHAKPSPCRLEEPAANDFAPTASWENLRLRADLLRRLRELFHAEGFLEVQTPILSRDTVVDRHLDPIFVPDCGIRTAGRSSRGWYLQTSPEFGMKRLLACGASAIYQITRALRGGELGPHHNVEFTIAEWYRVGDDARAGAQFLSRLAAAMLDREPAEMISYRQAFERHAGVDPFGSDEDLRKAVGIQAGDDRDLWLDLLMAERVQPKLGWKRPVIVYDFPASQAALAVVRDGQPPVAERFELFADGVELANGYHELTDPAELRRRAQRASEQRAADGKPPLPVDSRLLAAMQAGGRPEAAEGASGRHGGLPDCCGVALGFDRLVMVAAGAKRLSEVMAFPFDRA